MVSGNQLDHYAHEAKARGYARASWSVLRNGYFRDGTQQEAQEAIKAAFAERDVVAVFGEGDDIALGPIRR